MVAAILHPPQVPSRSAWVIATSLGLMALVFGIDLQVALGIPTGALYVLPVLLGLWARSNMWCCVLAVLGVVLVSAGYWLSPVTGPHFGAFDRALSLLAVVATGAAVHAKLRVDTRLADAQHQTAQLLDAAEALMITLAPDGTITDVNRKAAEVLGRAPAAIIGRPWADLAPPSEAREPIEVRRPDGTARLLALREKPLADPRGVPQGALISGLDVTEHEAARSALQEQESLARLGAMATLVAHEVKNPLAGITAALQVLRPRLGSSSEQEVIDKILARTHTLAASINELLVFAQPQPPRRTGVQARALLQQVADTLGRDPSLAGVEIRVREGEDALLSADPELLRGALVHLVLNAAQAMEGRGVVELESTRVDGHAHLEVRDQGPGIPEELRSQVLQPFFTTRIQGTGLGLPLVKRAIEAHGGTLEIACPPSGGTRVHLALPLRGDGADRPSGRDPRAP